MEKMRVLLADDHPMFREGIRMVLEHPGEVEVVGEARNGLVAVEETLSLRPDLVVMDIAMPDMNGLDATREIRHRPPGTKVLMLTMYGDDEYFFQALEAGASGYVLKEGATNDLLYAMQTVRSGQVFLYPSLGRRLVEDYLRRLGAGTESSGYESLTRREREILGLIANGHTNREIAEQLCLSLSTVETHRQHLMDKLDLHSRAHLMQYAVRMGLLRSR